MKRMVQSISLTMSCLCLMSIFFLLELCKTNVLLQGFNHSRQWTQSRERASTIISKNLYMLQTTDAQGLANHGIISVNLTNWVCHIGTKSRGRTFSHQIFAWSRGSVRRSLLWIDIYLFLLISTVLEF